MNFSKISIKRKKKKNTDKFSLTIISTDRMLGTIFGKILKILKTEDNRDRDLIRVQFLFFTNTQVVSPPQRTHTLEGQYLQLYS